MRDLDTEFGLVETTVHGVRVITVSGQADLHTAPQLRSAISAAVDGGARRLVIDLTGSTFIDSMIMGVIVGALKRLKQENGHLAIACPSPALRRIFEITSLDQVLDVTATSAEAIALTSDTRTAE